jgi:hypothetical protein
MPPTPGFDLSEYLSGMSLLLARENGGVILKTATAYGTFVDCSSAPDELNAVVITGKIVDGTHTITLYENTTASSTNSTAVAKAGTFTELSALGNDKVEIVNFKRTKRYVGALTTVANATSGGAYCVAIVAPKKFT